MTRLTTKKSRRLPAHDDPNGLKCCVGCSPTTGCKYSVSSPVMVLKGPIQSGYWFNRLISACLKLCLFLNKLQVLLTYCSLTSLMICLNQVIRLHSFVCVASYVTTYTKPLVLNVQVVKACSVTTLILTVIPGPLLNGLQLTRCSTSYLGSIRKRGNSFEWLCAHKEWMSFCDMCPHY